jgi:5-methylcytosine-specific restriction protein A
MPRRNWGSQRSAKLRRQAQRAIPRRCAWCGSADRLELDHTVNLAAGGTDTLDNVQWLCTDCHRVKTQQERTAGIREFHTKRYRDVEAHPGML